MATLSRILAWRIPWTVCGVAKSWTPLSMHICINVILLEERSLGKYSSFCSYARKPLRRRFPWPPRLHTHLHAPVVNSEQHLKHSVIIFKSNILSHFSNLFIILFSVSSISYIVLDDKEKDSSHFRSIFSIHCLSGDHQSLHQTLTILPNVLKSTCSPCWMIVIHIAYFIFAFITLFCP